MWPSVISSTIKPATLWSSYSPFPWVRLFPCKIRWYFCSHFSTTSGFGLLLFCCFHVYLVVHNLTTSEFFKRRAQGRISPHAYALENSLANVMELLRPRYLRRLKKKAQ